MPFSDSARAWVIVFLCIVCVVARAGSEPELIERWRSALGGEHIGFDHREVSRAAELFTGLFRDGAAGGAAAGWAAVDFRLVKRERWWLLEESAGRREGRGFFGVSRGGGCGVLLQAPHGLWDLDTGEIALRLAARAPLAGFALNTLPRMPTDHYASGFDLADLDSSFFQSVTRGFAHACPHGVVVQLHGFAQGKRRTAAGRQADWIVSGGVDWPAPDARALARCLGGAFDGQAALYPLQVQELGGTANAQGRLLRALGHGRFIHLEIARSQRRALLAEPARLEALAQCLLELTI